MVAALLQLHHDVQQGGMLATCSLATVQCFEVACQDAAVNFPTKISNRQDAHTGPMAGELRCCREGMSHQASGSRYTVTTQR